MHLRRLRPHGRTLLRFSGESVRRSFREFSKNVRRALKELEIASKPIARRLSSFCDARLVQVSLPAMFNHVSRV